MFTFLRSKVINGYNVLRGNICHRKFAVSLMGMHFKMSDITRIHWQFVSTIMEEIFNLRPHIWREYCYISFIFLQNEYINHAFSNSSPTTKVSVIKNIESCIIRISNKTPDSARHAVEMHPVLIYAFSSNFPRSILMVTIECHYASPH